MNARIASSDDRKTHASALADLIKRKNAELAAMSPVDRALAYADQRQSFVRGMVDHMPDFSTDPLAILAAEVRRLRRLLDIAPPNPPPPRVGVTQEPAR